MQKILVAYDFSSMADGALAFAADRARGGSVMLKVVYVLVISPTPNSASGALTLPSKQTIETARADLERAVGKRGVSPSVEVLVGSNAGAEIVIAAREFGADEIVLGTRGQSGLRRALLGSVADWVVRHAPCPVTTIRQGTSFAAASAP